MRKLLYEVLRSVSADYDECNECGPECLDQARMEASGGRVWAMPAFRAWCHVVDALDEESMVLDSYLSCQEYASIFGAVVLYDETSGRYYNDVI